MKISKSFKTYINIILSFFIFTIQAANSELSGKVIIYDKPLEVGELKIKDFNLQEIDLSEERGKIMVLNFWATWCAPCKKEMPSLEKLAKNHPDLKIFPINLETPNKERTSNFYKELEIVNLDIFFDPDFNLPKKFKMRGLPTTILIDKKGNEFGRVIGEIDFSSKEFYNLIEKYL
tara:strand:- start:455 stop:982 length:528 start_codon:yes stop_codon:yes gene_type:complete